jgi:pimeloyl-ACP methyl ester carboxylesterase
MPSKQQRKTDRPQSAPSLWLMALEFRAPWELGAILPAWPLLRQAPTGDGHPVIVFPGLSTSDASTLLLRSFIGQLGYDTSGWNQGFNFGPRVGVLQTARQQIIDTYQATGNKVSLVGWSLGGIYARELAKVLPDYVRAVITLGTPFTGSHESTNAWRLFELTSGRESRSAVGHFDLATAPPVPTTSIYSRSDGVVAWSASIQAPCLINLQTENLEVIASHLGLAVNPCTWWAVADRLSQGEGQWQHFERRRGLQRLVFPDPLR